MKNLANFWEKIFVFLLKGLVTFWVQCFFNIFFFEKIFFFPKKYFFKKKKILKKKLYPKSDQTQ